MAKNLGWIRNPLTIIGIFSTLTEGLCIVILPQLSQANQSIFIWFVIGFPTTLLLLFFYTLVNHNTKLYAPGDFSEDNLEFAALFLNRQEAFSENAKESIRQSSDVTAIGNYVPIVFLQEGDEMIIEAANNFFSELHNLLPKHKFQDIIYKPHNSRSYTLALVVKMDFILESKVLLFSIVVFEVDGVKVVIAGSGTVGNAKEDRINYILNEINRLTKS